MGLEWNPFANREHNTFVWPRICFHALHILLGLPVALLAHWLSLPVGWTFFVAAVIATLIKFVWLNCGRPGRRSFRLEWSRWRPETPDDWGDAIADLGFTLIGAFALQPLWLTLPLYYVFSLGSDP